MKKLNFNDDLFYTKVTDKGDHIQVVQLDKITNGTNKVILDEDIIERLEANS